LKLADLPAGRLYGKVSPALGVDPRGPQVWPLGRVLNVPLAANYSAMARMSDGRTFKIRALKRDDEADVMAAVARTSPQSLYRRFFGQDRFFPDQEIAYYPKSGS